MTRIVTILSLLLVYTSCKKTQETCNGFSGVEKGFKIYEQVLDTFLITDTSYVEKDIFFKANERYNSIAWVIGNDSRNFNTNTVNLRFDNPEQLNITLKGNSTNADCKSENFTSTKSFVVLDNRGAMQSPLAGKYRGYNTDNIKDTFTVAIKFWFGPLYSWWSNGAYSVENLPKGYVDSTQNFNGYSRPEIKGIIASSGYKNIAIDKSGNLPSLGIKGYGHLFRGATDTLIFNYTIIDTPYLNANGQIKYIKKQFMGIKN